MIPQVLDEVQKYRKVQQKILKAWDKAFFLENEHDIEASDDAAYIEIRKTDDCLRLASRFGVESCHTSIWHEKKHAPLEL